MKSLAIDIYPKSYLHHQNLIRHAHYWLECLQIQIILQKTNCYLSEELNLSKTNSVEINSRKSCAKISAKNSKILLKWTQAPVKTLTVASFRSRKNNIKTLTVASFRSRKNNILPHVYRSPFVMIPIALFARNLNPSDIHHDDAKNKLQCLLQRWNNSLDRHFEGITVGELTRFVLRSPATKDLQETNTSFCHPWKKVKMYGKKTLT